MKKQSQKKYERPRGLAYRLPGSKVKVNAEGIFYPLYGSVVRNIYAKPDTTRPTLCEVTLDSGIRAIFPSLRVKVIG
jgi:hypothetical protein